MFRRPLLCALLVTLVSPASALGRPRTTAVLDRFEGDRAVLVTDGGETLTVAADRLPRDGRAVDSVFRVDSAHGTLVTVEYDAAATRRRRRTARERFERLSRPLDRSENQS